MRRDYMPVQVPAELKQAEALLERYGAWAQDRYKKQRCASAEGNYKPPHSAAVDCDGPMLPFIADWSAMQVQHALQAVPMQWRRVLLAYYIPQRLPHFAARRIARATPKAWDDGRIAGLRSFWQIYSLRYLTNASIIAPTPRY